MVILLTGGTGFIGRALTKKLVRDEHELIFYVRNISKAASLLGDNHHYITDMDDITAHTTINAVINLAGEPVAASPWTKSRRNKLMDSRINTTRYLVDLIKKLDDKPDVMISASAAGIYGDGGSTYLTEEAPPQDIFMSNLCRLWEEEAGKVTEYGTRLFIPRLAVVLGREGGALKQLSIPAKFGLGAVFSKGDQYFPWVHLDDITDCIIMALENSDMKGPCNAVAPGNVTQREFMKQIATHYNKSLFIRVPAYILKLFAGEMSDLFLKGQNMSADKLQSHGFEFKYPKLAPALEDCLD